MKASTSAIIYRDFLPRGIGGIFPSKQKKYIFQGSIAPILTCSLSRKNAFLTIFHSNISMCFMQTFPMKLELTIYYLPADSFSYLVSIHSLLAEYENPCLITC